MNKIQFKASVGANPMLEYQIYDTLTPSGVFVSIATQNPTVQLDSVNNKISIGGVGLSKTIWEFADILDAGGAPFGSALLAYNYLVELFSTYATASRGAGGGGGGGDATAANQATQIGLATTANATLTTISNTLLLQKEFSESIWIDSLGTYYVRTVTMDEATGVITITQTLPDGTPYVPTAPVLPASSGADTELVKTVYRAIAAGVGYSIGDIVTQIKIVQTVSPFSLLATVYFNNTTDLLITPIFADLELFFSDSAVVTSNGNGNSETFFFKATADNTEYSTGDVLYLRIDYSHLFTTPNTVNNGVTETWYNLSTASVISAPIVNEYVPFEGYKVTETIENWQATNDDLSFGSWSIGNMIEKKSVNFWDGINLVYQIISYYNNSTDAFFTATAGLNYVPANNPIVAEFESMNFDFDNENDIANRYVSPHNQAGNELSAVFSSYKAISDLPFTERLALNDLMKSTGFALSVVSANDPSTGDTTTYYGYSSQMITSNTYDTSLPQFSIMRVIDYADGSNEVRWANGQKFQMDLIFDDYATYTY